MLRSPACFIVVLLGLFSTGSLQAAETPWIQLDGDGYRIYSQMPEQATRDWSLELDRFIGATTSILGINRKSLAPLKVVLFRGDKEFSPFKTARADGKVAQEEGGHFYRNESGSYMVLSGQGGKEGTRHVLFHEATHWILDTLVVRRPLWYEEGLADLFGTYKIEAGQVVFGQPIPGYIREFRSGTFSSLRDFMGRDRSLGRSPLESDRYYAQAWAMMHFYFVDPKGRQQSADVEKYLLGYSRGENGDLVDRYFGDRLKAYETSLARYIDKEQFYQLRSDVKADPAAASRAVSEPIRPDLLNTLATLALSAADKDLVQIYAAELQSSYGASPDAREVALRLAYLVKEDAEASGREAAEALRKGSTDSMVIRIAADALGQEGAPAVDRDRRRANMYRTVIARKPRNERAHLGLLGSLLTPGVYQASDADYVAVGKRLYPQSRPIRELNGALLCVKGEHAAAVVEFDAALSIEGAEPAVTERIEGRKAAALAGKCPAASNGSGVL